MRPPSVRSPRSRLPPTPAAHPRNAGRSGWSGSGSRSEEHTSELQSPCNLVCRLLLEKNKIAFDADPKFFACLVRFESSSVPTTLPTAYDVYPLDGRHDGGYYTVKDCVTIDVLRCTPGNNVYVGLMVWSNFTSFFF